MTLLLCLKTLQMNDPLILAFDVFNVSVNFLKENRNCPITVLSSFFMKQQRHPHSKIVVKNEKNYKTILFFWGFQKFLKNNRNEKEWWDLDDRLSGKCVEECKDHHSINLKQIYADI